MRLAREFDRRKQLARSAGASGWCERPVRATRAIGRRGRLVRAAGAGGRCYWPARSAWTSNPRDQLAGHPRIKTERASLGARNETSSCKSSRSTVSNEELILDLRGIESASASASSWCDERRVRRSATPPYSALESGKLVIDLRGIESASASGDAWCDKRRVGRSATPLFSALNSEELVMDLRGIESASASGVRGATNAA